MQLLFLAIIEPQRFRYLLCGFVGHRNYQYGDFCLHSRPILAFCGFRACLHPGGKLVHLPEHLGEKPALLLVHGATSWLSGSVVVLTA